MVNRIAKWDGSGWSALSGPSGVGTNLGVAALAVYDDGGGAALFAAGYFTTAGGLSSNHVARWNGASWSTLTTASGTGVNALASALAVYDDGGGPELYVGGDFTTAGGVSVNHIAKWDGAAWSALSSPGGIGVNLPVLALAVYDDGGGAGEALYAGGAFTFAGGTLVSRIARWNGSGWSALTGPSGTGTSNWVTSLAVFDDGSGGGASLYAGGLFTSAGGVAVDRIAKWDGSEWSALSGPLGTGVTGSVNALAVYDDGSGGGDALYAGGTLATAGGVSANRIARWNGTAWTSLSPPEGAGTSDQVNALTFYDDSSGSGEALYAAGSFVTAGGVTVNRIAKWDGTAWSALAGPSGTGVDGTVFTLTTFDDGTGAGEALYAGGDFTMAGGVAVNRVARWDGTAWSALAGSSGTGVDARVSALTAYDDGSDGGPALYAGGSFMTAGGVIVNRIAKWSGGAWAPLTGSLGTGVDGPVSALASHDDGLVGEALYVGGQFTTAGGLLANRLARWDGSDWSILTGPAGPGADGVVWALAVYDDGSGGGDELYAGGAFVTAGGVTVNGVARWDGSAWSPLSGPGGIGVSGTVVSLQAYDDEGGGGGALFAGGSFSTSGGVATRHISRWNGIGWSSLPGAPDTGVDLSVLAMAVAVGGVGGRETLYVGGQFFGADGLASSRIAAFKCLDSVAPSGPGSVESTSHQVSTFLPDPLIDMTWSGSIDSGGSGLSHYRVTFDEEPLTVPGGTTTVSHGVDPHTFTSAELSDGTWYFHLAPCDAAGNCGSAVHRGPYGIDTVSPSPPSEISSTSHQVGVPSATTVIETQWQASADGGSGVAGYAWTFQAADSWTCEGAIDGSSLSASSAALPTGQWWFHVCAIDGAGNLSSVGSVGPFTVDLAGPSLVGLDTVADTGDGELESGEVTSASITQLLATFDERVAKASAEQVTNWSLVATGPDGVFDSVPCGAANGADVNYQPQAATVVSDGQTVRLDVGAGLALPAGRYRLTVCPAITDAVGNAATQTDVIFGTTHTNLVVNPNLDSSLTPWVAGGADPGALRWSGADAEGKETSGSLEIVTSGVGSSSTTAAACIDTYPGQPLVLGGALDYAPGGGGSDAELRISVRGSTLGQCLAPAGAPTEVTLATGPTAGWQPFAVSHPGAFSSIQVAIEAVGGTSLGQTIRLDLLTLDGPIFADGFETGDTSRWSSQVP